MSFAFHGLIFSLFGERGSNYGYETAQCHQSNDGGCDHRAFKNFFRSDFVTAQLGSSFTAETLRTQNFTFSQRTKRLLCDQSEFLSVLCVSVVSSYPISAFGKVVADSDSFWGLMPGKLTLIVPDAGGLVYQCLTVG